MNKIIILIMSFALVNVSFADEIKTIHFATEATYPPFEYVDAKGTIKGFDVDITNAICQSIHASCDFVTQSFNSLIPSVAMGKFDAVIASIGITPEREQKVAFTQSYYQPSGAFVGLKANHYQIADLVGKTIGAQEGSTFKNYLQDKYGDKITIKSYTSIQDAFLDLISGRVDAVLADTPIAADWLQQDNHQNEFAIIDKPIIDKNYFGVGYGIAIRKDNANLLTALNAGLNTIKQNGTYDQIMKKYFANLKN